MLDGRGFAFVDPHGDSAEALLSKVPKERVEDVVYFNPSDMDNPIGLNMFEFDHPDQKDFLVQEAIGMLYGLYDPGHTGIVGPRLEHIFRNCALLLMSDPGGGTFIDIPKLLIDDAFMKSKLKYVTDQQVLDFWTKEFPASQRSSEAGEVISWVVSKFGPFISNDAMRNIIGQKKSGFNFADIMNNRKILLANLSKGKMGDLNSKLLGIIFVMKFQAAAMARANIPEEERKDFTLYVDEFQNFATDSFETILSEARKYRLSLVLGNQFMTQLQESLREAILGNVGTTITGRIGITDAEIMVKRYTPVFDAEDLTKLPNFESVCVAQIEGVPSAPFSMSWVPHMGQSNQQLGDALKRLSAVKFGHPRAQVEREIFERLKTADTAQSGAKTGRAAPSAGAKSGGIGAPKSSSSSFLDEWLAKRKQMTGGSGRPPAANIASTGKMMPPQPAAPPMSPPPASTSGAISNTLQSGATSKMGGYPVASQSAAQYGNNMLPQQIQHPGLANQSAASSLQSASSLTPTSTTASLRDDFNTVTSVPQTGMISSQQPPQQSSDGRMDAVSSRQDDEVTIKLR